MQEKSHNQSQLFSRLEKLRVVRDLSWDQLAELIGVNRSYFFHIKAGRKTFSSRVLYRLEQAEREAGIDPPPTLEDPGQKTKKSEKLLDPVHEILAIVQAIQKEMAVLRRRIEAIEPRGQ